MEIIYDTEHYQVELHADDANGEWYWIVNKEFGLSESKESLKPQALVFCEQFNILLQQNTHKLIAKQMVDGMSEEALMSYSFDTRAH